MKVIITGATGMVGEGVMQQCLLDPAVTEILLVNRNASGYANPKLHEIIHENFFDFSTSGQVLSGYDACFFCLGVSSIGMKENEYFEQTYNLTLALAEQLSKVGPGMTFCYISGAGTDSSETSRTWWARIKGKTENALMRLPFEKVFAFRPGFIKPTKGLKKTHHFYRYITWLFPLGRLLYPTGFCTMEELGKAMIRSVSLREKRKVIAGKEIIQLAAGKE
ncbi:MAG: NAD-dependent epimerase/dehydratase family protein [Chitinophagaceae bacterium]